MVSDAVYVGVDIGAAKVEMLWRRGGRSSSVCAFDQDPQGHAKLISELKRLRPRLIVLEATGIYYLDLALALVAAGLPVAVINPKSFHHFAKLKLTRSKTDGIDASLLAEYGERMAPPLWKAPAPTHVTLRDIGRQINRLTHARTQAKNRLHALCAKRDTLPLLIEDERQGIELLDRRIERLTQAARELLVEVPELQAKAQHMLSAKGIGEASAIALLAELCVLPPHLKANQVSRHAGLDVRLWQSGTSVEKPGRLSKHGNAYLRAGLYMPVLSAVRHDPYARAFYEALLARGKKKLQAHCAVMRKYLTGLWACIQLGQDFDSSKLFSDIHLAKA